MAVAATVTVPETVAPAAGAVIDTVGGVPSSLDGKAYVMRRKGRIVLSGCSMLAKKRWRPASWEGSALRRRPKLVAGLASHSWTMAVIVQALYPRILSIACVS